MTWVIGARWLNIGAAISDIRVTLRSGDNTEAVKSFGVQKVHPINSHTVVGFAGSVVGGFELVGRATRDLGSSMDWTKPIDGQLDEWVASGSLPSFETDLLFIRLSPHPDAQQSTNTGIRLPVTAAEGCIIRGPGEQSSTYRHDKFEGPVQSIGSGSDIVEYTAAMRTLITPQHMQSAVQFNRAGLGAGGLLMTLGFEDVIREHVEPSISKALHYTVITIEQGWIPGRNAGVTKEDWPPIADSLASLETLAGEAGVDATAVIG